MQKMQVGSFTCMQLMGGTLPASSTSMMTSLSSDGQPIQSGKASTDAKTQEKVDEETAEEAGDDLEFDMDDDDDSD